jgi:pimeloyl-ACP methyl ester carboxylesterase
VKTFVAKYIRQASEADLYRDLPIHRFLVPTGAVEYIYCTATLPVDRSLDGRGAVIICPPFLEERILSQRLLVRFQKFLSRRGYVGIRFDYRGTGDSSGDVSQVRMDSMRHDLANVIEFTLNEFSPRRTCLLGVRLGGSVVLSLDDSPTKPDAVVLWSPVISLSDYIRELFKLQIVSDGKFGLTQRDSAYYAGLAEAGTPVEILGYLLNAGLVTECDGASQLTPRCKCDRTVVFRLGSRQHRQYSNQLDKLVLDCGQVSAVVNDRTVKCPPFWSDGLSYWEEIPELFEETLSCLDQP